MLAVVVISIRRFVYLHQLTPNLIRDSRHRMNKSIHFHRNRLFIYSHPLSFFLLVTLQNRYLLKDRTHDFQFSLSVPCLIVHTKYAKSYTCRSFLSLFVSPQQTLLQPDNPVFLQSRGAQSFSMNGALLKQPGYNNGN